MILPGLTPVGLADKPDPDASTGGPCSGESCGAIRGRPEAPAGSND